MSIDYLTFSGPRSYLGRIRNLLTRTFGRTPESGGGGYGFKDSYQYGGGGGVWYPREGDTTSRHIVVNVPGEWCQHLGASKLFLLMDKLYTLGFRATRLDIAVDFFGRVDLITPSHKACIAGQLCGARAFELIDKHSSHKAVAGRTLYLGLRGKDGSGRFVRVYDKGIQTGTSPENTWHRWEAVFSKDCADKVVRELMASGDDWEDKGLGHALGAVNFCKRDGRRESQRTQLTWWRRVVEGIDCVRVKLTRIPSDFDSYCRWVTKSVAPMLRSLGSKAGMTLDSIVNWIAPEWEESRHPDIERRLDQLRKMLSNDYTHSHAVVAA